MTKRSIISPAKYSYSRLKNPIELITADAAVFMDMNVRIFDLICIDIFNDDLVPTAFETSDFLEQCAEALEPEVGYFLTGSTKKSATK